MGSPRVEEEERPREDPYEVHFKLLVQAIKIRADLNEWMAVDLESEYHKVTRQERVPLHCWWDWIHQRLEQLT